MSVKDEFLSYVQSIDGNLGVVEFFNAVQKIVGIMHPFSHNPVTTVRYVPLNKIKANNYNPNSVASPEMKLLHTSISHDGYTMPAVVYYDDTKDEYTIVDGFHRYSVCMRYPDINQLNQGYLPVAVIEKSLADRMASTVRHNRARGKHAVEGMSNIVLQMLQEGKTDAEVCLELGLEVDELIKLKHITGFAKLFEGAVYSDSWESNNQIMGREKYKEEQTDESTRD